MPNTKLTKEKLKNHWVYSKWIYIFMTVLAVGLASLLYTVAHNHNKDEEYIGIALVDAYVDTSKLDSDADILLTRGKSYDSRLRKLEFIGIFYSSLSYDEMSQYSAQVYSTQLMAGECDIFIQDKSMTDTLLGQDYFVALDTLDSYSLFIEKFGEKKCEELFVWSEISVEGEEGDDAHTERHAYSIDISSLTGLITRNAYDCRGKYASILSRSANADTALYVLFEMFNIMGEAA